jgi:hypothetical protein
MRAAGLTGWFWFGWFWLVGLGVWFWLGGFGWLVLVGFWLVLVLVSRSWRSIFAGSIWLAGICTSGWDDVEYPI